MTGADTSPRREYAVTQKRGRMANPERGEVDITINEKTYTLRLSTNAAVVLEKKLNKSIGVLLSEAGALSFTSIREMVWLLLQKYHAEEVKTVTHAGELIDDAGGIAVFFGKLQELARLNEPEEKGTGEGGNAPAADGGPGETSISTPAASA